MAQGVKALAAKPDNLSDPPDYHGGKLIPKKCTLITYIPWHIPHTYTNQ